MNQVRLPGGIVSSIVAAVMVLALPACRGSAGGTSPSSSSNSANENRDRSGGAASPVPLTADLAGRTLAFVKKDGVYVGKADGSDAHRLTDIRGFEYQPAWTTDASRLVLRVDTTGRSGGVWSVNADGSHPVDLSRASGVPGGDPDWSPDGTRIAFVGKRPGEVFGIYVMNADGSNPIRLTSTAYEAQYPDWSPDGSEIAFTIVQGGGFDIFVMNADGSGVRQLTDAPDEDNWPEWSPDGTRIVYNYASGELWIMNADGTGAHLLTRGGEPSWSRDGEWIAFDCASSSDPSGGMCAIHPDGSGLTSILADGGSFPAWRP